MFFNITYVYVHMFICYMCVDTCTGKKRVLDPPELELQKSGSCLIWMLGIELMSSGITANTPHSPHLKGSLSVALAVLELALQTRLTSNSRDPPASAS